MNPVRRKLHSSSGATFVLALVIFLILALFSFGMVNASLTAARNTDLQTDQEQLYLTVSSSARVLLSELSAEKGTGSAGVRRTKTVYTCEPDGKIAAEKRGTNGTAYAPITEGSVIGQAMLDLVRAVDAARETSDPSSPPAGTLSISKNGDPAVNIQLTMAGDYTVTLVLTSASASGGQSYTMTIILTPDIAEKAETTASPFQYTEGDKTLTGYQIRTDTITTFFWVAESVKGGKALAPTNPTTGS